MTLSFRHVSAGMSIMLTLGKDNDFYHLLSYHDIYHNIYLFIKYFLHKLPSNTTWLRIGPPDGIKPLPEPMLIYQQRHHRKRKDVTGTVLSLDAHIAVDLAILKASMTIWLSQKQLFQCSCRIQQWCSHRQCSSSISRTVHFKITGIYSKSLAPIFCHIWKCIIYVVSKPNEYSFRISPKELAISQSELFLNYISAFNSIGLNSLWPSDATWPHRSRSKKMLGLCICIKKQNG